MSGIWTRRCAASCASTSTAARPWRGGGTAQRWRLVAFHRDSQGRSADTITIHNHNHARRSIVGPACTIAHARACAPRIGSPCFAFVLRCGWSCKLAPYLSLRFGRISQRTQLPTNINHVNHATFKQQVHLAVAEQGWVRRVWWMRAASAPFLVDIAEGMSPMLYSVGEKITKRRHMYASVAPDRARPRT